jgi:hypothetical protein
MKQQWIIGIFLIVAAVTVMVYVSMNQQQSVPDNGTEQNVTLTIPGKSHFGASETYLSPDSGEIEAGKNIAFELRIVKNQEGLRNETILVSRVKQEYSEEEVPLPKGMTISSIPAAFTSYAGKEYLTSIIISTTNNVSEDMYFFRIQRKFDSGIEDLWTKVLVTAPIERP